MTEPITRDEFSSRLVELCVNGRITGFPRRTRDLHILMKSVVLTFDAAAEYSEREVNEELRMWMADICPSFEIDHVTLRRRLIDEGYVERERDGSKYWASVPPMESSLFEPDVESVDVYEAIGTGKKQVEQRKEHYLRVRSLVDGRETDGQDGT
ncbi:MAG: DUF2087 domain-containing protein [Gemmatimonadetes bacterium]|nr:DUF2087 domain-containing protein [Gemmatimonadota bacterium]